jgi:uncharacterized protein (TIGR04255 family)
MDVPEKHPHYPNAQIAEALCEIHYALAPGQSWRPTAPGELFKRFQAEYPELEPITEHGVLLTIGADGVPTQQLAPPRLRFKLTHGSRPFMMQISEQTFTLNVLSPYPGWVAFNLELASRWPAVLDVIKPSKITRIGLRYINRIVRLSPAEKPEHWFRPSDYIATAALKSESRFLSRMETQLADSNRLLVTLAHDQNVDSVAKHGAALLDIDVITEKETAADWQALNLALVQLHDRAWDAFDMIRGPNLEIAMNREPSK